MDSEECGAAKWFCGKNKKLFLFLSSSAATPTK